MASGWEYVGSKKGKAGNKQPRHGKDLVNGNGPAGHQPDNGIKASDTIYGVFLEQEKRQEAKEKAAAALGEKDAKASNGVKKSPGKETAKKNQAKNRPKKKPVDPKVPVVGKLRDLDEAVRKVSPADLKTAMDATRAHFPENASIWLKDVAAFLNHMVPFEPEDPVFAGKPHNHPHSYPLSVMQKDVRNKIGNLFEECSEPTLTLFQDHCLQAIVNGMAKGNVPTIGYRLMLQSLAHKYSHITVNNLQRFVEARNSNQNRPAICLSVMWAASQAGNNDLKTALEVWFKLILPYIGTKAYSKYAVDSLENLIGLHANAKPADGVLEIEQFLAILDLTFTGTGLSANLQKQLKSLYPKVKALSFSSAGNTLRSFFPLFLRRLNLVSSSELKGEIVSCLIYCLAQDVHCFSVWRQLYTKHLVHSSDLLEHLSANWNSLGSALPKKPLRETLKAFSVTNEELRGQNKGSAVADCEVHCNDLLGKMCSQNYFPWKFLALVLIVSAASLITYDVRMHGSLQRSVTGKYLKDSGALNVWQQTVTKVTFYWNLSAKWFSKNAPAYYEFLNKTVGPYLQQFWQKLGLGFVLIWDSLKPVRDWVNINVPPYLEAMSNIYVPKLVALAQGLGVNVRESFFEASVWLQENVFVGSLSVENLQRYAVETFALLQAKATEAYLWVSNQYMALTK